MSLHLTSTANAQYSENARERWRLARRLFGELTESCQDYLSQLENGLSSSSPGLQGVPSSPFPESLSQGT